jgi:signal transduction histidine kinase/CheY-like chemotaxis protein
MLFSNNELSWREGKFMKRQNKRLVFQVTLIVAIVATILASVFLAYYMSKQLFMERSFLLKEICYKSARLVDNVVSSSWDEVDFFEEFIIHKDLKSSDDLLEVIEQFDEELKDNDTHLLVFNSDGKMYSSNAKEGKIIFGTETLLNNRISVVEIPYDDNKEYMLFVKQLNKTIYIDDIKECISHIAMAIDIEMIKELFYVSGFSDSCYVYILDQNTEEIYRHITTQDFIKDRNTFEVIRKQVFLNGGAYWELKQAIADKESVCMEFDVGGSAYYIATSPMQQEEWTTLMIVPANVSSMHTNSVVTSLLLYFIVVGILGIIISVSLCVYIVNCISQKKIFEEKEQNSRLLMDMAKEANSANVAKSNFISHMSHDIRTPINGIIGMTNIAKTHIDEPKRVKECLDKISGSSNHLLSLINDVLDVSRIESGKVIILKESFNINELVDNCISIIDGQMEEVNFNLKVEKNNIIHHQLVGDELHTRQILINILGNAVKFTPKRGQILFKIEEVGSEDESVIIRYTITDTGIGMSSEFLNHIFEPFAQESLGSRTNYNGTGLGMTITKKFVDLLGGTISITSVLHEGSSFVVEIPYTIHEEKIEANKIVNEINVRGMRVMLVEDNELNAEIAQLMLEENDIEVVVVQDGQAAVELFRESEPYTFDAILMDVMMPVMDGLVATRIIRCMNNKDSATIPIIAMTANAYREDIRKTQKAGMNEHISKPIDINLLLETLTKYNINKNNT